jgi:PmbA protein
MQTSAGSASGSASDDLRAELKALAEQVAEQTLTAGADAAEVLVASGRELSVKVRRGEPEMLHEAGSSGIGLRVFRDHRAAVTYTSDFSPESLARFVRDTVELSQLSEPDELNALPGRDEVHPADRPLPELELWDDRTLTFTATDMIERARAAEAAGLGYSPRISNSDGASCDRHSGCMAFASADRQGLLFSGASRSTYQALAVEVMCDDAEGKKRNATYWTADRFLDRLQDPVAVGREAARRAESKLGARKIETAELPVVFDPDAGRALLRLVAGAVSGGSIYRRSSYLCGREGTQIASPLITLVDDPLLPRALGSRPFDGDGLPVRRNVVIEAGVLKGYLLDTYSARKLGRKSNGCAGRGIGGSPHVTTSNFMLLPGTTPAKELIAGIERGLYVTEMMGFGFNEVTGDFSRGAAGFLIERGQLVAPVSEVTISAHFNDLWQRIDAVGDDLDRRSSTMSPSFRVSRMTVAGR